MQFLANSSDLFITGLCLIVYHMKYDGLGSTFLPILQICLLRDYAVPNWLSTVKSLPACHAGPWQECCHTKDHTITFWCQIL